MKIVDMSLCFSWPVQPSIFSLAESEASLRADKRMQQESSKTSFFKGTLFGPIISDLSRAEVTFVWGIKRSLWRNREEFVRRLFFFRLLVSISQWWIVDPSLVWLMLSLQLAVERQVSLGLFAENGMFSLRTFGMISHFLFIWVKLDGGGFAILLRHGVRQEPKHQKHHESAKRILHLTHSNWCTRCFEQGSLHYPFWVGDQTSVNL